jgi:MinD superfamily P-loop ATPase
VSRGLTTWNGGPRQQPLTSQERSVLTTALLYFVNHCRRMGRLKEAQALEVATAADVAQQLAEALRGAQAVVIITEET